VSAIIGAGRRNQFHCRLRKCDKKCGKNPSVVANADSIDSSAGKRINKFRVFNIAGESGFQAQARSNQYLVTFQHINSDNPKGA